MSLKKLVNDKTLLDPLKEFIEQKIKAEHKKMEISSDIESLYRHQGAIQAYRKLLRIREEVNGS